MASNFPLKVPDQAPEQEIIPASGNGNTGRPVSQVQLFDTEASVVLWHNNGGSRVKVFSGNVHISGCLHVFNPSASSPQVYQALNSSQMSHAVTRNVITMETLAPDPLTSSTPSKQVDQDLPFRPLHKTRSELHKALSFQHSPEPMLAEHIGDLDKAIVKEAKCESDRVQTLDMADEYRRFVPTWEHGPQDEAEMRFSTSNRE